MMSNICERALVVLTVLTGTLAMGENRRNLNNLTTCTSRWMGFPDFVKTYGKKYVFGTPEYERRKGVFMWMSQQIREHNCGAEKSTWTADYSHLADWSSDELASLRGYKRLEGSGRVGPMRLEQTRMRGALSLRKKAAISPHSKADLPSAHTWCHLASLQESRDQGACGSCWAFAADTAMRSQAEMHNTTAPRFSVEQIVSCTANPQKCGGSGGCGGATCELAFEYALKHGLVSDKEMPYDEYEVKCPTAMVDGETAKASLSQLLSDGTVFHAASVADLPEAWPQVAGQAALLDSSAFLGTKIGMYGWKKLPANREEPVLRALVQDGPLAVAIATSWEWNLYGSGLLPPGKSDWTIDHAVVVMGFGSQDKLKYWHIRNSWGNGWGEDGNIRLIRADNEEKVCGWDTDPASGTGCVGGPSKVEVCGAGGILYDVSVPLFRKRDF